MSAWLETKRLLLDTALSKSERSSLKYRLFCKLQVDKRTLNNWLASSGDKSWPGTTEKHEKVFREFLEQRNSYRRLSDAVIDILSLDKPNSDWSEYEGNYRSLRLGNEDRFIEGTVTISSGAGNNVYHHKHGSIQNLHSPDGAIITREEFSHEGPVFFVGHRIYFLGCGISEATRYFRPMIFEGNDLPHDNVLYGIVLTETRGRLRPLASAVALLSCRHRSLKDKKATSQLLDKIELTLKHATISDKGLRGILVGSD